MKYLKRILFLLIAFNLLLFSLPFATLGAEDTKEENFIPKEGVLYTLSWAESEKRIFSLEFALHYSSINVETLACGPLIASSYNAHNTKRITCAFYFKEVQKGYYAIIPAAAPDVCLQVYLENENKTVYGRKFDNKPEQLWTLTPCEGGIRISNAAVPDLVLGLSDDRYAIINVRMTNGEWIFKLEESQIVFPEHRIHVKAPDFWAPCIGFDSAHVFMPKGEDGWHSYYYRDNSFWIANQGISSPMAQVIPPDYDFGVQIENPGQDYWVVISDDPNVDGDLTYKVYDYNPDDEPLKPGQAYKISMETGRASLEIFPVTGLQGINLRMGFGNGGQLEIAFYFEKTEDGFYTISPACMPGWRLQATEGKVIAEKAQDIPEQKWTITAGEDGYTISSAADPTLFIGKNEDSIGSSVVLQAEPDKKIWKIEESQLEFSKHSLYVKAPEHWAPGLEGHYGGWNIGVMAQQENGWFSFPLWPTVDKINYGLVANLMVSIPGGQFSIPDSSVYLEQLEPDKDYWIVITDDPNVDGDLTYKVYDHNPDEESPKTADPVTLAVPAFILLTSTIAIAWLHHRRKTA